MRRFLVLLVAVSLTGAFTACGDDDDEERLTAAEFRRQANAICKQGNDRLDEGAEEAFGNLPQNQRPDPDSDEVEEFFDLALDSIQQQIDDLRELQPPADLEEEVDDLLEQAEQDLENLEEDGTEAFISDEDPFEETNQMAEDLNLEECAG